jgi:hypothetical protein
MSFYEVDRLISLLQRPLQLEISILTVSGNVLVTSRRPILAHRTPIWYWQWQNVMFCRVSLEKPRDRIPSTFVSVELASEKVRLFEGEWGYHDSVNWGDEIVFLVIIIVQFKGFGWFEEESIASLQSMLFCLVSIVCLLGVRTNTVEKHPKRAWRPMSGPRRTLAAFGWWPSCSFGFCLFVPHLLMSRGHAEWTYWWARIHGYWTWGCHPSSRSIWTIASSISLWIPLESVWVQIAECNARVILADSRPSGPSTASSLWWILAPSSPCRRRNRMSGFGISDE